MNIFKTFSNCLQSKSYTLNEGFDSFMFCRYLSMHKDTIAYAQILNQYYRCMDEGTQYEFVKNLKKPSYIRWIKYTKDSTKVEESLILQLMERYEISKKKAQEYAEC